MQARRWYPGDKISNRKLNQVVDQGNRLDPMRGTGGIMPVVTGNGATIFDNRKDTSQAAFSAIIVSGGGIAGGNVYQAKQLPAAALAFNAGSNTISVVNLTESKPSMEIFSDGNGFLLPSRVVSVWENVSSGGVRRFVMSEAPGILNFTCSQNWVPGLKVIQGYIDNGPAMATGTNAIGAHLVYGGIRAPGYCPLKTNSICGFVPYPVEMIDKGYLGSGSNKASGYLIGWDETSASVFPVTLSATGGGGPGDLTHQATWIYNVTDATTGTMIATAVDPISAPCVWQRPTIGYVLQATAGLAYYNATGALVLTWINEMPDNGPCPPLP